MRLAPEFSAWYLVPSPHFWAPSALVYGVYPTGSDFPTMKLDKVAIGGRESSALLEKGD